MRVLINGIAGFGGSGVATRLVEKGHTVRGIDLVAPSHAFLLNDIIDKIDYRWKNVIDMSHEDVRGCDAVFHFSAQADVPESYSSPRYTVMNNVMGTVAALEASRGVSGLQKFILASSSSAVQRPKYLPINAEHPPNPVNPYGASKASQELMCLAWHRSYGVPVVIYRNGVIYGPNMRREIFIFKWLWNILHGKQCVLEGGEQTRDPTYHTDAIDAWMLGVEADSEDVVGETFQVGYGKEYTVRRVLRECMRACGKKVRVTEKGYRPGEKETREKFDISKAKRVLGYAPKVPLAEGLQKTTEWIRSLSM